MRNTAEKVEDGKPSEGNISERIICFGAIFLLTSLREYELGTVPFGCSQPHSSLHSYLVVREDVQSIAKVQCYVK